MKVVVWFAAILGLYTGWCWAPAYFTPSQLESGVENVLEHLNHASADSAILDRTWKTVDSKGLYVAPENIRLRREQRPGERIVEVEFEIPVSVDWLGTKRTLGRPVLARHVYEVDEAAEARRLADLEAQQAHDREQNRRAMRRLREYQAQVRRECAKGSDQFYTESVLVTFSDGSSETVNCAVIDRW